jgi:hypothetical protein
MVCEVGSFIDEGLWCGIYEIEFSISDSLPEGRILRYCVFVEAN